MRSFTVLFTAFVFSCVEKFFGSTPIDEYIENEGGIAKGGILANIGPDGAKSHGAASGVVIASPNTYDPDYLYTWIRDASLTFKLIAEEISSGEDTTLRGKMDEFFLSQRAIQQVPNRSGSEHTGGLGEPKFDIDETQYDCQWGRPQRDGPALRATTFVLYANWLISNGNTSWVLDNMWPVIARDLDYVHDFWNRTTVDLWEEITSSSFFTTAVQLRALRQGIDLGLKLNQTAPLRAWYAQAQNILCFLQSYKNTAKGYITANTGGSRSGIDSNTVLASIHIFDPDVGCDAKTFQPCSDVALSNLKVYVDSFRSIYRINKGIASNAAVATGRYPEDVYYGGNPWYLSTFAVAEQLYDALLVWDKLQEINVTDTSLAFFRQFISDISTGSYPASKKEYSTLVSSIQDFADGFVLINAKYTPSDGGLAEQYNRDTGVPLSAKDLTWSYASALTAFASREGFVPTSWGAGLVTLPSTCGTNAGPTVSVTFNVNANTKPGENIFVVGSIPQLGNWSPDKAVPLAPTNYPSWGGIVTLPGWTYIEYKYINKNGNTVNWTSDPNWNFKTPDAGSTSLSDTWR